MSSGRPMAMTVRDIGRLIESWAPSETAWEEDNVGLQCGDAAQGVRSVLVALDPSESVIAEAVRRSVQMLITHHPLLFHPARRIDVQSATGRILQRLIASHVSLFSAHTNLDASPTGTNTALADVLALTHAEVLYPLRDAQKKFVTFVPPKHADAVADALSGAGAGLIGKYERCSFRGEGIGTFLGNAGAQPAIGTPNVFERTPEVRLEMIVPQWNVKRVIDALRDSHPYEEPAFDIYPLDNPHPAYGMGVVGDLKRPCSLATFLKTVKHRLGVPMLRHSPDTGRPVRRVAACGGSGSRLLEEAIRSGADVFVTADVTYHTFQNAAGRIVLIDAGHFETENPVVGALAGRLRQEFQHRNERIAVRTASAPTNPVRYV